MYNNREYKPTHLSTGTTSQVFTGKGIIHALSINAATAVAFGIYDGLASTSVAIAVFKASAGEGTYLLDATVANGLYVTYGAGGDFTVLWTN